MASEIKIEIPDKTLTKLAGYDFGFNLYNRVVKDKLNLYAPFTIVFPDQVNFLAASFIVGFFGEIFNQIGMEGIHNNMNIKSKISNLGDIEKTLLVM